MKKTISQALAVAGVGLGIWLCIETGQQLFAPRIYAFATYDSKTVYVTQRRWLYPDETWTMHARFNRELGEWTWQIKNTKGQWMEAFSEPID
jgi:hypothetical protein